VVFQYAFDSLSSLTPTTLDTEANTYTPVVVAMGSDGKYYLSLVRHAYTFSTVYSWFDPTVPNDMVKIITRDNFIYKPISVAPEVDGSFLTYDLYDASTSPTTPNTVTYHPNSDAIASVANVRFIIPMANFSTVYVTHDNHLFYTSAATANYNRQKAFRQDLRWPAVLTRDGFELNGTGANGVTIATVQNVGESFVIILNNGYMYRKIRTTTYYAIERAHDLYTYYPSESHNLDTTSPFETAFDWSVAQPSYFTIAGVQLPTADVTKLIYVGDIATDKNQVGGFALRKPYGVEDKLYRVYANFLTDSFDTPAFTMGWTNPLTLLHGVTNGDGTNTASIESVSELMSHYQLVFTGPVSGDGSSYAYVFQHKNEPSKRVMLKSNGRVSTPTLLSMPSTDAFWTIVNGRAVTDDIRAIAMGGQSRSWGMVIKSGATYDPATAKAYVSDRGAPVEVGLGRFNWTAQGVNMINGSNFMDGIISGHAKFFDTNPSYVSFSYGGATTAICTFLVGH